MSFFGFDTALDRTKDEEDLAVYTYGEEGYENLAAQLDEELDELNDETFGDSGTLSKDFDYARGVLPSKDLPAHPVPQKQKPPPAQPPSSQSYTQRSSIDQAQFSNNPSWETQHDQRAAKPSRIPDPVVQAQSSGPQIPHPAVSSTKFSPFEVAPLPAGTPIVTNKPARILTLEEVEAEQSASARLARMSLNEQSAGGPHLHSGLPAPAPLGYDSSPVMPQAIPTNQDLELLRFAQQHHQQHQARQVFAQQHQQRQQDLYDMQRQESRQRQLDPHVLQQGPQNSGLLPVDLPRNVGFPEPAFASPSLQNQLPQQPRGSLPDFPGPSQLPSLPPHLPPQERLYDPSFDGSGRQQLYNPLNGPPGFGPLDQQGGPFLDPANYSDAQMYNLPPEERDALLNQAMFKIVEAERNEDRRRRRMHKIASMAKYNDLMTQGDKDFITRIQVTQLVTQDPYAEDFYAQTYIVNRQRQSNQHGGLPGNPKHQKVLSFGQGGGVGIAQNVERRSGRRENALLRMQTQIEKIVNNAKNKEKAPSANLQGALGKISGRSYKVAPRQLLQVESSAEAREGAAKEAANLGRAALADAAEMHHGPSQALTPQQVLLALEGLYDVIIDIEDLQRSEPSGEDPEEYVEWNDKYMTLVDKLWSGSKIMAPLETSDPHPFISLLGPAKGIRLLPRLLQHIDSKRASLFFTLLVACYRQLDIVKMSRILDDPDPSLAKAEVEKQTALFISTVLPACQNIVGGLPLRFVTGILGLILDGGDVLALAQTPAGISLFTLLLGRSLDLKQTTDIPPQEAEQLQLMIEHLGQFLSGSMSTLFPSVRLAANQLPGVNYYVRSPIDVEAADQNTWIFFSVFAMLTTHHQQGQIIVELREKILDNVLGSTEGGWVKDDKERTLKIQNANTLLNPLGLDASLIAQQH